MSDFDPAAIIVALEREKVSYVVVGGVAVLAHGHLRTTQDLDLVPDPDPANLGRLAVALRDLEGRLRHPAGSLPVDAERLGSSQIAPIDTRHGRVDVISIEFARGAPKRFAVLRDAALTIDLDGVRVQVAALDHLISMKRALDRPQDRRDIAALTRVERGGG